MKNNNPTPVAMRSFIMVVRHRFLGFKFTFPSSEDGRNRESFKWHMARVI
jgi:hypothetical protein